MIIDFSSWSVFEGASEGSGRSEKVWLINDQSGEVGLFKFTKSEKTTEHISEKIASDLAGLLGLQSARIDIGTYKSRIGSMSYLINRQNEVLIEGIYLLNKIYPGYDPNIMYDETTDEYYSLEMILRSIDEYNLIEDFLRIVVFDFLIGNTDRHQNNWAILSSDDEIRMCPIYDNGSSLCCYVEETSIESYLGTDKIRLYSLINSKSRSRIRINSKEKKEPAHLEVLQYVKDHYSKRVEDFAKIIIQSITEEKVDCIMNCYPENLMSSQRKRLIKVFLLGKVGLITRTFKGEEE